MQHETIESIYTHDPNGYMVEITRALRPVTPQEDLDAELTIDALVDVASGPEPSHGEAAHPQGRADRRARAAWAERRGTRSMTTLYVLDVPENLGVPKVAGAGPGRDRGRCSGPTT